MLHVAPEQALETRLKACLGSAYVTADLHNSRAMIKMDVTDIRYPNDHFDVIYCSHVLEHVRNDRRAMSELYRVLKKSGWAILLVPIEADQTFEDPTVTDPKERLRLFGNPGHVRRYGPDFADRLRDVGFVVAVVSAAEFLSATEINRMGITSAAGDIYYCQKK
jgi:SAM-dependent methyltransferase